MSSSMTPLASSSSYCLLVRVGWSDPNLLPYRGARGCPVQREYSLGGMMLLASYSHVTLISSSVSLYPKWSRLPFMGLVRRGRDSLCCWRIHIGQAFGMCIVSRWLALSKSDNGLVECLLLYCKSSPSLAGLAADPTRVGPDARSEQERCPRV